MAEPVFFFFCGRFFAVGALFGGTPTPGPLFCNFLPTSPRPPDTCASGFKALNPSQAHHASIVFANGGGRAAPRPNPRSFEPCQLASEHVHPVQAYHARIGFANGGTLFGGQASVLIVKGMFV